MGSGARRSAGQLLQAVHHELSLGNLDLLALLPIALGLAALARGHERLGEILMALGVCVKPTAAAVLLAPLLAGRWRVTALALAAAVAVTLWDSPWCLIPRDSSRQ